MAQRRPTILRYQPVATRPRTPHNLGDAPFDAPVLVLDVRRLQLQRVLEESAIGQLVWDAGARVQMTALYSFRGGLLTIHELARGRGIEQAGAVIRVVYLHAFGGAGTRPWLVCPGKEPAASCGTRALKLFLPHGENTFSCRRCSRTAITSGPLVRLARATSHSLALA